MMMEIGTADADPEEEAVDYSTHRQRPPRMGNQLLEIQNDIDEKPFPSSQFPDLQTNNGYYDLSFQTHSDNTMTRAPGLQNASNVDPVSDLYRRSSLLGSPDLRRGSFPNTSPMQFMMERIASGHINEPPGIHTMSSSTEQGKIESSGGISYRKHLNDPEIDMHLPFPIKLHYILSKPEYQHCIAWLPHGRAWRITLPKEFEKTVIPRFFRSDKYASFMRQVNGWAFVRITEGPDANAYYHERFLRGIPDLSFHMKRPPKVKNAASDARNATGANEGTPDFYRIAAFAPLPRSIPFKPEFKVADNVTQYIVRPLSPGSAGGSMDQDVQGAAGSFYSSAIEGTNNDDRGRGNELQGRSENSNLSLSNADISYLVHQNKVLLAHLQSQSLAGARKDETMENEMIHKETIEI